MDIPHIAWFAVTAACLAGCIAWHRKAPSRPLFMALLGFSWILILSLPDLYATIFGYKELSRYTDSLFTGLSLREMGFRDSGSFLVFWCGKLSRLGTVLLALGLWKLGSALTPEAGKHPIV